MKFINEYDYINSKSTLSLFIVTTIPTKGLPVSYSVFGVLEHTINHRAPFLITLSKRPEFEAFRGDVSCCGILRKVVPFAEKFCMGW